MFNIEAFIGPKPNKPNEPVEPKKPGDTVCRVVELLHVNMCNLDFQKFKNEINSIPDEFITKSFICIERRNQGYGEEYAGRDISDEIDFVLKRYCDVPHPNLDWAMQDYDKEMESYKKTCTNYKQDLIRWEVANKAHEVKREEYLKTLAKETG